ASSPTSTSSCPFSDGRASTAPRTISRGAWSPPMASRPIRIESGLPVFDDERHAATHIPAVVAGSVGELGVTALGAGDQVRPTHRMMRTALALTSFGCSCYGKHLVS